MPPPGRPNDPPAGAAGALNERCGAAGALNDRCGATGGLNERCGACTCGGVYARWKDGGGACGTDGAANVRAAGGACSVGGAENARVGFTVGGTVNVRGGGR